MTYLKDQNEFDHGKFLKSQEMVDLFGYIKRSFSWKAGNYEAIIEIDSPEEFNLIDNRYGFSLTPIDIEDLDKDKSQIEKSFEILKEDKSNEVIWYWRYPLLSKLKV